MCETLERGAKSEDMGERVFPTKVQWGPASLHSTPRKEDLSGKIKRVS